MFRALLVHHQGVQLLYKMAAWYIGLLHAENRWKFFSVEYVVDWTV